MPSDSEIKLEAARELLASARSSIERIYTTNGWGPGHPGNRNQRWTDTRSALEDLAAAVQALADSISKKADR